jgi:hypothetical protein
MELVQVSERVTCNKAPKSSSAKQNLSRTRLAGVVADGPDRLHERPERGIRHHGARVLVDRGARLHEQALHVHAHLHLLQAPRAEALHERVRRARAALCTLARL